MTDQRAGSASLTKCRRRSCSESTPTADGRRSPAPGLETPSEWKGRSGSGGPGWQRREPGQGVPRGGSGAAAVLGEGVARGPVAIFWAPRQSPTRGAGRAAGGPSGLRGGQQPRRGRVVAAGREARGGTGRWRPDLTERLEVLDSGHAILV